MAADKESAAAKAGSQRAPTVRTIPEGAAAAFPMVPIVADSVLVRRRRIDRMVRVVVPLRPDAELAHHVVVLVHEVVAVDHVPALVRAELHDDAHGLALAHVGDVLRALLVRARRPAV